MRSLYVYASNVFDCMRQEDSFEQTNRKYLKVRGSTRGDLVGCFDSELHFLPAQPNQGSLILAVYRYVMG